MTATEERRNNPKLSGQMEEYFTNHAIFPEIAGEFPFQKATCFFLLERKIGQCEVAIEL